MREIRSTVETIVTLFWRWDDSSVWPVIYSHLPFRLHLKSPSGNMAGSWYLGGCVTGPFCVLLLKFPSLQPVKYNLQSAWLGRRTVGIHSLPMLSEPGRLAGTYVEEKALRLRAPSGPSEGDSCWPARSLTRQPVTAGSQARGWKMGEQRSHEHSHSGWWGERGRMWSWGERKERWMGPESVIG